MALLSGTRLGPYEIVAPLGAGGMGEVYKARDTRLDRTVAIKILPPQIAADPQFRERFDREARAISALDHPHICALYDVGEQAPSTGSGQAVAFLVMQYLEGETLAERLARSKDRALPNIGSAGVSTPSIAIGEALTIAIQIADALATAHRQGITHRDLKPGNIMLTKSGAKLLDFGLAKTSGVAQDFSPAGAGRSKDLRHAETALTMTSPITAQGAILGTFQYMAPEQLEGHEADPRTDIFAFGAVVYEMVTGRKAFEGKSQASLIAAILEREPPPISRLQPLAPPMLDRIVRKCLAKDPDGRWQSARDLHDELTWIAETGSQVGIATGAEVARPRPLWRRVAAFTAVAVGASALVGTTVWLATRAKPVPAPRVSWLQITPPNAAAPTITALTIQGATRDVAITPDGTRVVYTGANGTALFVRALDHLDATPLTGLGSPVGPFFSPDGQWIGFFDGAGNLKKVAITGGPAVQLVRLDGAFRGASWGADGTIVFATNNRTTGLQEIATGGGEPTVRTRPDRAHGEEDHLWPELLPGGQAILFTIAAATGGLDQAKIAVLDLRTETQTTLIRGGSDAHYVPGGHLVYGAAGTLRAVGFDLARLAIVGTAMPVVPQVVTTNAGGVNIAVASDGTLVYIPGGVGAQPRIPVWVDRQGQETPIPVPPHAYDQPRISPDGVHVALHAQDDGNIWLWDIVRNGATRFAQGNYPVWTLDGRLFFNLARDGAAKLFTQAADGTGAVTPLTESPNAQRATALSPDGTRLVFSENNPATDEDLMQLQLDGAHDVTSLVHTPSVERNGEISPDGHWLAYEANDSGSFEIFVRPFPDVTRGRWPVSTGGGRQPLWSRNRNSPELFYLAPGGALMRVAIGSRATWAAAVPAKLLDVGRYYTGTGGQTGRSYDIASDGRFLMIKPGGGSESTPAPTSLVVVQHFDEDLKRLLPAKP